ncbi:MAG: DUF721 domain-containing protein [Dysgonamonadaceae bacterium]|jgi:predicted nucleic acid-binding Zn ribbon protein|nr:DUF721 domain-containing protein [Dysgonamonadaceae bacterium]
MERRSLEHISKALQAFFEDNPRMADKLAETRLIRYWNTGLGSAIAHYTSGLTIRNRTLYVRLTSAVLKNELLMMREQLIHKLNVAADRKVIEEIVFQ